MRGRESRNNNGNDNNDDDNIAREQDSSGEGGGGEIRAVNLGFPETEQRDIWLRQFSEPVVRLAPSIDTDYVPLLADSYHERGTQWD